MSILAFDTTLDVCSAALRRGDGQIFSRHELMPRGQAERMPGMISEVLQEAAVSFAEIAGIAVTHGPGTFSGTRIGLALARGFNLVHKMPVVGYSSLAVIAAEALRCKAVALNDAAQKVLVVNDARRQEVYVELFAIQCRNIVSMAPPRCLPVEHLPGLLRDRPDLIVGSGAHLIDGDDQAIQVDQSIKSPDARALLILAANDFSGLGDKASVLPEPLYLRAPDAKLPNQSSR